MFHINYILYNGELYHHGVKGQRWGFRRYQNPDGTLTARGRKRQAKAYQKELNDIDDNTVKEIASYMRNEAKFRSLAKKRGIIVKKNNPRNSNKLKKINTKLSATKQSIQLSKDRIKKYESDTWKLIGKAASEEYTVSSKRVMKNAEKGRSFIYRFLLGKSGAGLIRNSDYKKNFKDRYSYANEAGIVVPQTPWNIQGNKYEVH